MAVSPPNNVILYVDGMYPDADLEKRIFGPEFEIVMTSRINSLADLTPEQRERVVGLLIWRVPGPGEELKKFPNLKGVVRMGVGYDIVDRKACAELGVGVMNVPDYGTAEVSEQAISMTLALRRGLLFYHYDRFRGVIDRPRSNPDRPVHQGELDWRVVEDPVIRRMSVQTFGILGLGRIGTASALKAKAFGFRVIFYDPYVPNGFDRAIGVERYRDLDAFLRECDVLSLHCNLNPETRGIIGAREFHLLKKNAIFINTSRGPTYDIEALYDALKDGHLSGAGLDVLPVEPPKAPYPRLVQAYKDGEEWLNGKVIITPHAAYYSPEAYDDIRLKSAETMRAFFSPQQQNVIPPNAL
ncbi:phosphoglycerate dehydrogenase [Gonapodya prolifera JEL478]|uniref:Phosphoglycerate dehydrogenase n=1 Tax=Gonapodya prolifera (strain JEL478) TaxID=1344416 RepID=A0A139ABM4_GONPJ|nr:phosphoglycerate dehydrogenase [Gonapodya prolifera JEL478]|eukprot:KXS13875.1 phosphoglycerate dehydrogenase [Gonapodya prolifera JEL478]